MHYCYYCTTALLQHCVGWTSAILPPIGHGAMSLRPTHNVEPCTVHHAPCKVLHECTAPSLTNTNYRARDRDQARDLSIWQWIYRGKE